MNKFWLLIVFLMFCILIPSTAVASPEAPSQKTAKEELGFAFHGNQKSFKFHAPDCRYYNCKNCTIILHSLNESQKNNFSPCGLCKPQHYHWRLEKKKQCAEPENFPTTPTPTPQTTPVPSAIETEKSVVDGKG
ncbi:hypothetical protein DSLASN_47750 [Desulfoluna limicola]|uniref:Uncharacterized protein n=1 Tax=Desulfoluna limicola TaxID=2810562 RepID=A0ABM7PPE6_9BACT|nr:hypothetical protein [Desulfoluna limicola]BCS99143.1 hypothetical protein DSLASN_47750 [Desulfoluna limicola]